uniref:Uncharacterized protein n=1 Tax=Chloropicon primus TaxID=1764295 RepID=A0A7S2T0D8_9CHLO
MLLIGIKFLIEERESHVVIRLLLLGLLLLLLGGSSTSSRGTSGGNGTTSRDGSELLGTGSDHLVDVLSGELLHELGELVVVSLSTDGGEDLGHISGRWAGVSSENALRVEKGDRERASEREVVSNPRSSAVLVVPKDLVSFLRSLPNPGERGGGTGFDREARQSPKKPRRTATPRRPQ